MSHLNATRKGWQNEHLGLFILSQLAFCASPVTISDDLGSDLFCCLFRTSTEGGKEVVRPLNSFAIQLKSGAKSLDASNKVGYLRELEIPFFIGVVERLGMTIYSGEYLPLFFSKAEPPRKLRLKPVNRRVSASHFFESFGPRKFRVLCPRVLTLEARASKAAINKAARRLHELCRRIHGNIATRRTEEHVYSIESRRPYLIMAGPGSARVFRDNLYLRLAEAFYNFAWLLKNRPKSFRPAEAQIYIDFFHGLGKCRARMPRITKKMYRVFVAERARVQRHAKG